MEEIMQETTYKPARKWYAIWWDVWRHPGSAVFQALKREGDVTSLRGYLWVGLAAFVGALVNILLSWLLIDRQGVGTESVLTERFVVNLLSGPINALIGLGIVVWICHKVATLLGGNGDREQLTFSLAAIQAPASLIATVYGVVTTPYMNTMLIEMESPEFSSFASIFTGLFLVLLVYLVIGIYAFILGVSAVKGVMNLTAGKAAGTFLIGIIVYLGLYFCMITFQGMMFD
jgi:hypothetical protein